MKNSVIISGAVEGVLDEGVLRRLIRDLGAEVRAVYGKNGKPFLLNKLDAYNHAAHYSPWIVIIDLDHDAECAPPFVRSRLPDPAPNMNFRVAVREIEAWLLADRERFARFLSVSLSRVPRNPEALDSPKGTIVELARHSRRREIREGMVPRPGSGLKIGPSYTSLLLEFVKDTERGWRPTIAAQSSDSLNRCIRRLAEVVNA